MPGSNGRVHANVVELAPGRLAAFMRSRAADFIYRSESLDDGNTWSEPVPTVLPNNNSSITPAQVKSLQKRLLVKFFPPEGIGLIEAPQAQLPVVVEPEALALLPL